MNGRRAKMLRRTAEAAAIDWLKSVTPEEQHKEIDKKFLEKFQADQDDYVYGRGSRKLSAFSPRWFYKKFKRDLAYG